MFNQLAEFYEEYSDWIDAVIAKILEGKFK